MKRTGTLIGCGSATVFAKGDVGGSISGTANHASVIARGSFVGTVTAGVDATLGGKQRGQVRMALPNLS